MPTIEPSDQGNILPAAKQAPLGPRDVVGLSVFAASLAFEVSSTSDLKLLGA